MIRLMIGHIRVGVVINYFILTRLTIFDMHEVNTSRDIPSGYISFITAFNPIAHWKIVSYVIYSFIGLATMAARISKHFLDV